MHWTLQPLGGVFSLLCSHLWGLLRQKLMFCCGLAFCTYKYDQHRTWQQKVGRHLMHLQKENFPGNKWRRRRIFLAFPLSCGCCHLCITVTSFNSVMLATIFLQAEVIADIQYIYTVCVYRFICGSWVSFSLAALCEVWNCFLMNPWCSADVTAEVWRLTSSWSRVFVCFMVSEQHNSFIVRPRRRLKPLCQ